MGADNDFLGQGLRFPLGVERGALAASSENEVISESIRIILGTAKGERVMRPDFGCGIHGLVFSPNSTSTSTMLAFYVREALARWEPRIDVGLVTAVPDSEERNRLNVTIEYIVKKSNTRSNLVYPFYLEAKK